MMVQAENSMEKVREGLDSIVPEDAKALIGGAMTWIRNHPEEAAIIGAAGGFVLGLTGLGRFYRGVSALRSMPFVSQFVMGAVANGLASKHGKSVH